MAGLNNGFTAAGGVNDWLAAAMVVPDDPAGTIVLIPIAARTHSETPRMAYSSFEITTVSIRS
jgi:hypothetical protein